MAEDFEQFARSVMSGEARGIRPATLRAALSVAEPFYRGATSLRNRLYHSGVFKQHQLDRPVISIGNITTGGTGKTPMVQWITRQLLTAGHCPAILTRGYKSRGDGIGDEPTLLQQSLQVPIRADPDRVAGGRALLQEHPGIDVFLLDDGFQHRRLARDLDIVLIDATEPFGYGHILPRGLLRESPAGLGRADFFVLTRADQVATPTAIVQRIQRYNSTAPIVLSEHRMTSITDGQRVEPMSALSGRRIFSFCGIGNPTSFHLGLLAAGAIDPGHRWYSDHQEYSAPMLEAINQRAAEAGAEMLVTTEKDWVKIEPLLKQPNTIPIWRVQMEMQFTAADAATLIERITTVIKNPGRSSE